MDINQLLQQKNRKTPAEMASDDDYWTQFRKLYRLSNQYIHFNHGGVSPQPLVVQKKHIELYKKSNLGPTHYMWKVVDSDREKLRAALAKFMGADAEEIAINRNTTEGLNSVIFGLPLQKDDEVILSKYDYPNMMNAWKQREKRDGIRLNWVDLNLPEENTAEIVRKFEKAITPATKIVHISYVINWTGQILPVKEITEMAHKKGCEVIVDGAHALGQLDVNLRQLNCDYFAASLHKWLCAPFGTGVLYIKKEKIPKIWPLLSAFDGMEKDIRKFEILGTRSFSPEMAVQDALDLHLKIGAAYKIARKKFLRDDCLKKINQVPGVRLYTSNQNEFACGMATFGVNEINGFDLEALLFENYRIQTCAVVHEKLNGVRISPHFFTSTKEIDKLVEAIRKISNA